MTEAERLIRAAGGQERTGAASGARRHKIFYVNGVRFTLHRGSRPSPWEIRRVKGLLRKARAAAA